MPTPRRTPAAALLPPPAQPGELPRRRPGAWLPGGARARRTVLLLIALVAGGMGWAGVLREARAAAWTAAPIQAQSQAQTRAQPAPPTPAPPPPPSPPGLHKSKDKSVSEQIEAVQAKSTKDAYQEGFNLGRKLAGHPAENEEPAPGAASANGAASQPLATGPFGDRVDLSRHWMLDVVGKSEMRGQQYKDDPLAAARPDFDDSGWEKIDTHKTLIAQGIFGVNELWYRTRVEVPPGSRGLAVSLADIGGSYRVYANGVELGGHGAMRDRGDYLIARSTTYAVPDRLLQSGSLLLAVHVFAGTVDRTSATLADGISPRSQVFLGPAPVLERDQQSYFEHGRAASSSVLTLWFVLLVLALALALLVHRQPMYPALATAAAGVIVSSLLIDYAGSHYLARTQWLAWPITLARLAAGLGGLEFCRVAAGVRRTLWFKVLVGLFVASSLLLAPAVLGSVPYLLRLSMLSVAGDILVGIVALVLLGIGVAARRRDALILGGACGLALVYVLVWNGLRAAHFTWWLAAETAGWLVNNARPATMFGLLVILGLFAVLLVHTVQLVRERATIAGEIEAARTMQQLLLARSSEPTPGFAVETAYLPAGELGGDFFLVTHTAEGSLAAVVGDVSGKGLLAAMRVSMILGVLRREPSREPATVLQSLNQALLAQAEMGFTTACAVELCPDGRFRIANAGHIAPYLTDSRQSVELPTVPNLPLGLTGSMEYEVLEGRLEPGERLVLLSDGVPEARSHRGELFGFDRTGPLTLRPAGEIASTALAFGQEDDITVVTLSCAPGSRGVAVQEVGAPAGAVLVDAGARVRPASVPPPPRVVPYVPPPPPPRVFSQ